MLKRTSKDWASQILKDLSDIGIDPNLTEIRLVKEDKWKELLKKQTTENALI